MMTQEMKSQMQCLHGRQPPPLAQTQGGNIWQPRALVECPPGCTCRTRRRSQASAMATPPHALKRPDILNIKPTTPLHEVIQACVYRANALAASEADPNGPLHRALFRSLASMDAITLKQVFLVINCSA